MIIMERARESERDIGREIFFSIFRATTFYAVSLSLSLSLKNSTKTRSNLSYEMKKQKTDFLFCFERERTYL